MEDFEEVGEGEVRGDGVDAYGALFGVGREGLVEGIANEGPGVGFVGRCDTVFEIVGYAVGGEGAGFVEEALRGAGNCVRWC